MGVGTVDTAGLPYENRGKGNTHKFNYRGNSGYGNSTGMRAI